MALRPGNLDEFQESFLERFESHLDRAQHVAAVDVAPA